MSDHNPDANQAAQAPPEPQPAPAAAEDPAGRQEAQDDDLAAVRREAAQRRRQLREVEAERDQLRARLDDHDRREVERIAGRTLADTSDLWGSAELEELRDDDGTIDRRKVEAAVDLLVKRKPHFRRPAEAVDWHAGARPLPPEPRPSLGEAIKEAGRR